MAQGARPGSPRRPPPAATPTPRAALLLHSSGTTGLPKIVRRTGASLDAEAQNCADAIGVTEHDRVLAVAPLCHSYGIEHGLLMPMIAGAAVELPAANDPHTLLTELAERQATTFPAVPFVYEAIVSFPDDPSEVPPRLPHLRRAYSAGGPLPREVAEAFHRRFGLHIGQVFGSTEVGSVTYADPASPAFSPTGVGRAMHGVDLRILDRDTPDPAHPLPVGEEGQLAIAAPSMLQAYVGEDTPPAPDGFFFTGDLARLDSHGNLHITGRLKLLINVGGRKVNPAEVEAVLMQHPAVREAVVLPVAVTRTVSRLRAVIVPADGVADDEVDVESVRRFVRERLSSYKVPRLIEVRRDLPRSATGKVLRGVMADG